ncbi:MAG: VWA domain-containing protein [Armatimonadetes bacterium]|nr:VWA domain-containing protein [Armatimonadota bacterium]
MTSQVVTFVRALRQAGVRVSLAEALDACAALEHIDCTARDQLRLALQAALVKDPRDQPTFARLFEQHFRWHLPARKRRAPHPQTHRREGTAPRPGGEQPGRLAALRQSPASERDASLPPLRKEGEPPPRPAAAGEARAASPTPGKDSTTDAGRRQALAALLAELDEGMSEARREAARQAAQHREALWHLELQRRLPPEQAREVADAVEQLARKLVSRESLRQRQARRGRIDVKSTLARSVRTGGVPFYLARRRRRVARSKLLLLCDVSGSVRHVAALLMRLVHRIQNQFARTHSFVFVDRPVDVTRLFQRYPLEEALARLEDLPELNLNAYSDFGNTFYELCDDHLPLLDRDTVVLILGDARTNEYDPMEWALEEVRRRVRRVVWLNPEPPARWNTHDSAISRYAPFCDDLLPCGTLAQLAEAASRLLRGT